MEKEVVRTVSVKVYEAKDKCREANCPKTNDSSYTCERCIDEWADRYLSKAEQEVFNANYDRGWERLATMSEKFMCLAARAMGWV